MRNSFPRYFKWFFFSKFIIFYNFPINIWPSVSGMIVLSTHRPTILHWRLFDFWTITHNEETGIHKQSSNYLKSWAVGTFGFRGIIAIPPSIFGPDATEAKPSSLNELNWPPHFFKHPPCLILTYLGQLVKRKVYPVDHKTF